MAWGAFWPLTAHFDFSDPLMLRELFDGYAERRYALGLAPPAQRPLKDAEIGWFTNAMSEGVYGVGVLQKFIEDYGPAFIDPDVDYEGADDVPACMSLATIRSKAGLNANGFYRITKAGQVAYGLAQHGDYPCPRPFNEIRACLNVLTRTLLLNPSWTANGTQNRRYGQGINPDWPSAQADAETAFDAGTSTANYYPYAYTRAQLVSGDYYADMNRLRAYCAAGIPTNYAKSVQWFALPKKYGPYQNPCVWDGNGDFPDELKWHRWLTDAVASAHADPLLSSAPCGQRDAHPTWCTITGPDAFKDRGYDAEERFVLIDWTGFTYRP